MVLKTRKHFNTINIKSKTRLIRKRNKVFRTMKGGSNNTATTITKVAVGFKTCNKTITDIFNLAYKLNRHRLVEKIIYNLSGGEKYARIFGIKLESVEKGQQWFKNYGKIDELINCLNEYFFVAVADLTNTIMLATKEIQDFLNSKSLDGVRHEMRILLLLLLFLIEKCDKITMPPNFFINLNKSLEHIEDSTGQSKIKRFIHTKIAILYFLRQHKLLDKYTTNQFDIAIAINNKSVFTFADDGKNTQTIINLMLTALEINKYKKDKIEIERLRAEQQALQNAVTRHREQIQLNLARKKIIAKKIELEAELAKAAEEEQARQAVPAAAATAAATAAVATAAEAAAATAAPTPPTPSQRAQTYREKSHEISPDIPKMDEYKPKLNRHNEIAI